MASFEHRFLSPEEVLDQRPLSPRGKQRDELNRILADWASSSGVALVTGYLVLREDGLIVWSHGPPAGSFRPRDVIWRGPVLTRQTVNEMRSSDTPAEEAILPRYDWRQIGLRINRRDTEVGPYGPAEELSLDAIFSCGVIQFPKVGKLDTDDRLILTSLVPLTSINPKLVAAS